MSMRRTLHILVLVVLSFSHSLAGRAMAQRPEPVDRAMGRIPSSAEVVVVIDGLAASRRLPAASALFDILSDLRVLEGDMLANWKALSTRLGWADADALDRLLGSRVVLVLSSLDKDAPWAVMSEISNETDQRIRETIPIAPRKAVDGVPVIAVERGDYEMATIPRAGGDERVMLLLGPAKRAALFDTMVRSLSKGVPDTLAKTPVVAELAAHKSPGLLLAVRLDPEHPDAARRPWDDFIVCTATPRAGAWECNLAIRDADMRDSVRRIEPGSDAPYRAISRNALLAVFETRLASAGAAPANIYESILALFALPKDAGDILTGRQAIAIWPRARPANQKGAAPALCCAMALEASDVGAVAPAGDLHLAKLVQQVERTFGSGGHPIPDFAGVSCQAVRTIPLDLPPAARRVFDGQPQIAWSYPASPQPAPDLKTPSRAGWWQVCVSGAGEAADAGCNQGGGACADASRQMVAALTDPAAAGAETDRWVSMGMIRPARWVPIMTLFSDSLARVFGEGVDVPKAFTRLDRIEWRLAVRENDDVGGTLRIEMTPAPGAK